MGYNIFTDYDTETHRRIKAMAAVRENFDSVRQMSKRERFIAVKNARAEGRDWNAVYENIRQVIDPMDVMSDTDIFGVEIPWELWR